MKQLVRTSALLAVVVALLTLGLVTPASAASKTGNVKGVVTLDGKPLKGLKIGLYWTGADGFEGKRLAVDTTDSKGAYSFKFSTSSPDTDNFGHTVIIQDPSYRIVNTSRSFIDRPGKTVTRNASVKPAASVTGSVKRGDGIATKLLQVDVFGPYALLDPYHETVDQDVYDAQVPAATDGSFALRGLPAGDYYLELVDRSKTYFSQCYDNISAADSCDGTIDDDTDATKISVKTGQKVTLNPQVLSTKGQRISGTVTDTSGRTLRYATVTAVKGGSKDGVDDVSTSTGAFKIGPLTDGQYRLSVDPDSPWAPQTVATVFDIAGSSVSGVQIKLKSKASIKATLTPGKGTVKAAVVVTRSATGSKPSGKVTVRWGTVSKTVSLVKGTGTAKLSGLPKGKRRITITYSGTSSTAAATKVLHAVVK